jgi:rhodanese-related sulfurtransferase
MNDQATIRKGYKQLISEANSVVKTIPASEALGKLTNPTVVLVDIRDLPELERDGKIPGAIHASRGMLEFYVDPESPYHKEVFATGKQILLYCASGGRSALAAQRLQEMGFNNVAHMGGGFKAWKEAGGSVESVK